MVVVVVVVSVVTVVVAVVVVAVVVVVGSNPFPEKLRGANFHILVCVPL